MKYILSILTLIISLSVFAQNDLTDKNLYYNTYDAKEVIDETYGIVLYEKLNIMLGKDSVRNGMNGYAANGFIEDYYKTGELLHKGFYVDGQLKVYKNYYPNGNVERNFRMVDIKKSKMTLFYQDGTMKSDIVYIDNEALTWIDYYPNGAIEFEEIYDKSFQYYEKKAEYFSNGKPQNILLLVDKKKLTYTQTSYFENGNIKEQGAVKYDRALFDYQRIGDWKIYNESGAAIKIQKYVNGTVQSEQNL